MRNKELVTALEALPEKELGVGWMYNEGCYCAVGAMVRNAGAEALTIGAARKVLGLPDSVLTSIIRENDGFKGTNAERYDHIMEWARK